MPAPAAAVYVAVAITGVAVVIAFKEFVYEPHIAPKLEKWAEEYVASRRERRRLRGLVPSRPHTTLFESRPPSPLRSGDDNQSTHELERLVAREIAPEVDEWRNGVESHVLRRRTRPAGQTASTMMDDSNISIPFTTLRPTHVLANTDEPATPTSTIRGRTSTLSDFGAGSSTLHSLGPADSASQVAERLTSYTSLSPVSSPTQIFRAPVPTSPKPSGQEDVIAAPLSPSFSSISTGNISTAESTSIFESAHDSVAPSSPRMFMGDGLTSLSFARTISPFSDVARAGGVTSPFSLASEGDTEGDDVLSLHSGMSSLQDDDDDGSDVGSDGSWASIDHLRPPQ
ncbi:hypothetical protein JAAARDRAFT_187345 [Jaapia argillacea MUCL 33604]|uniref:Transmembrane protein n=1 Tax=Jaapia argillacea MUCL 33604 TaxID=933084 RepID=A0A067QCU4_9AGAM|nr:hypothetical protein JAAARDRAFT_187345 [Jaapia argillacea MUCL 33604]